MQSLTPSLTSAPPKVSDLQGSIWAFPTGKACHPYDCASVSVLHMIVWQENIIILPALNAQNMVSFCVRYIHWLKARYFCAIAGKWRTYKSTKAPKIMTGNSRLSIRCQHYTAQHNLFMIWLSTILLKNKHKNVFNLVTIGSAAWLGPHRPRRPLPLIPVRPTGFLHHISHLKIWQHGKWPQQKKTK